MSTELPEKESLEDNALENQKKEAWNEWIQKVGESLITSVSISSGGHTYDFMHNCNRCHRMSRISNPNSVRKIFNCQFCHRGNEIVEAPSGSTLCEYCKFRYVFKGSICDCIYNELKLKK